MAQKQQPSIMSTPSSGLYLHVPFCRRKCIYCDFYTAGVAIADWDAFTRSAINEIEARIEKFHDACINKGADKCSTIYFGGGTPSLLPANNFRELAEAFLKAAAGKVLEFTVEVNPEDVSREKAELWKDCGATRISMGVQTLDDGELKTICRRHDAMMAIRAFEILRREFDNISLDLIFGLPGQSLASLKETISKFIELRPDHISGYSLMYEERTALTALRDAGKIDEIEEELSEDMFNLITMELEKSGYEQYELSNYCLPGKASLHNSAYWKGCPYLGIGPSAHSYDGERLREANPADVRRYIKEGWQIEGVEIEELDDNLLREEMIMTRLRTREGIDLREFRERFGEREEQILREAAAVWVNATRPEESRMKIDGHSLYLTKRGIMIADDIISSLF